MATKRRKAAIIDPSGSLLRTHNASRIREEIEQLFDKARRAGVQIECIVQTDHEVPDVHSLELAAPDNAEKTGYYVTANPDADLTPEMVL